MGKSITPTYVIDMHSRKPTGHTQTDTIIWDTKTMGRANAENLERWILVYGKSFGPGGVNFHVSESLGYLPYPNRAVLRRQPFGGDVAVWTAPPFFVW